MDWFKLYPQKLYGRIYGMSEEAKGKDYERLLVALVTETRGIHPFADEMMEERERYLEEQSRFGSEGQSKRKVKRRKGKRNPKGTPKAPSREPLGTLKGDTREPLGTPKGASREPQAIYTDTDTDKYPDKYPDKNTIASGFARRVAADARENDDVASREACGATGTGGGENAAGAAVKDGFEGGGADRAGGGGGAWDVGRALAEPCEGMGRLLMSDLPEFAVRYCGDEEREKAIRVYKAALLRNRREFRCVLETFVKDVEGGQTKPQKRGALFTARLKKAGLVA